MAKRKQTPDVLAEILNDSAPAAVADLPLEAVKQKPVRTKAARPKAESKPSEAKQAEAMPAAEKPLRGEKSLVEMLPRAEKAQPAEKPAPAKAGQGKPAARKQAALPPLKKPARWEYCLVTFQEYKGWRPRFVDGLEVHEWMAGPTIQEYLRIMGEDGWELAAAASGGHMFGASDGHQLYFKREK